MQFVTLRAALNDLPLPTLVLDSSERVRLVNHAGRTLLGREAEGRHYVTVLRQPSVSTAIETAFRTSQPTIGRYVTSVPEGERSFDVQVSPFFVDGSGALIVSFEDTTPLEAARQMRQDFVANVSHELRTPLTALMGFIETLQGSARDDPAAQARFLKVMEREAGRMNRLVGDLLSLSRVESDERRRPTTKVELQDIIRMTLSALDPAAEENDVTFVIDAPPEGFQVPGDYDQLTQVFQNLIENAIKYGGRSSEVTVRIARVDRDVLLRTAAVRVDVSDQGEGIDSLHLPRLTERFYRIDNHRSREMGGTGLGLAIVKHIINRHRGRLKIESEVGVGTVFSVFLPIS